MLSAVFSGLLWVLTIPEAFAQVVWTGSGDGTTWNSASNWNGAAIPGSSSIAQFGASGLTTMGINFATGTNNGTANQIVGRLTLDSNATIDRILGNSSATAGTLTLAGNGGVILENLNANLTLTLASNVGGGSGGMTVALPTAMVSTINAAGDILVEAGLSGGAFDKSGAGKLILAGTNTTSGFGRVSGGTLQIGNGGSTGSPGDMHLALSNNANVTFNRSGSLTYIRDITGIGSITQAGSGTTILTGSGNSYSGTTTITAGTLQIGNGGTSGTLGSGAVSISAGGTLLINRSNIFNFTSALSGSGTLQKDGTGVLAMNSAANASFTGQVSILGGGLNVQSASGGTHSFSAASGISTSGTGTLGLVGGSAYTFAVPISGSGNVSFSATAPITLSGNNSYTGSTTIGGGSSSALVVSSLANGGTNSSLGSASSSASNIVFTTGVLRYTGSGASTDRLFSVSGSGNAAFIDANGSGALQFTNTGAMGFNGQTGVRDLVLQGTSSTSIINTLAMSVGDNSGATKILKRDANTWILNGSASTYTGATLIQAGVLGAVKIADGGSASSIGMSGSASSSLVMSGGGILRYTGSGDTTNRLFSIGAGGGGGIESSGTGPLVFSNTGDVGSNETTISRAFTLGGTNTGDNVLAAAYKDMGSSNSLVKSGPSKWILAGNNTYTGGTTISGGTLQIGNGGITGAIGSGTITNNGALVINRSDTTTLSQTISGSGSVTQQGPGITILNGNNSYTGPTTITAGTLQIGNGSTTGSAGSGSITNHGTLIINRSNNLTWSASITGSGGFTQAGSGTTTFSISPAYTGPTTVSAGKLQSSVILSMPSSNFTVASGATLATNGVSDWSIGSLSGAGTLENGAASGNSMVSLGGAGSAVFTGLVRNGSSAVLSITKTGGGTQGLDNSNTFSGSVIITQGMLSTNSLANGGSASGIGASSNAAPNLVLNGGMLAYTGGGVSTDRRFHLGSAGGGLDASGTGAVHFTHSDSISFNNQSGPRSLTLGGTSTAANSLSARITDSDAATSLIKSGIGTWVLAHANNTYTGGTTLNAGVLRISSSSSIGTGQVNFSGGVLETTQSMSIANQLVVNNSSNGVRVAAGTLTLNGSISGSFPLYKDGPGLLVVAGGSNSVTTVVQSGRVQGSAANAGASISLGAPTAVFEFNQAASGTYGGIISGSGGISLTGTGGLTLTAANSYDGETVVNSGVLSVISNSALGSTVGGVTVQSGGTLHFQNGISVGAETILLNGQGASGQPGALVSSAGSNTHGGSVVATTHASIAALPGSTLNLLGGLVKNGTTATLTGGGSIVIGGAGISGSAPNSDLVVNGSGTVVTLSTSNSYNGPTFIQNSGTLVLGQSNILPTSPRTDLSLTSGGSFNLNGHSDAVAALAGDATTTVRNSAISTTSTLEVAPDSTSTFSGVIAGSLAGTQGNINLVKTGAGTLVLDGPNTYSGTTFISAGTLQIGSGGSIGQIGGGTITNDGTLRISRSGSLTLSQMITGNGVLTQSGTGTTILAGNNTYSGGTLIESGRLRIGDGGLNGSAGVGTITNQSELEISRSNNYTLSQVITGGGSLLLNGSGETTLSGNSNTYSGGTIVRTGTLMVTNTLSSSSATGSGSVVVENGARLAGTGRIAGPVTFQGGSKLEVGNLGGDFNGRDLEFGGLLSSTGVFEARFDVFRKLGDGILNSTIDADQLVISGPDRLIDMDIHLVIANPNSLINWAMGDAWSLLNWGSIRGSNRQITITSLSAPALSSSLMWDTSQINTTGNIFIAYVPEPSRVLLLLIGLLSMGFRRRKR